MDLTLSDLVWGGHLFLSIAAKWRASETYDQFVLLVYHLFD